MLSSTWCWKRGLPSRTYTSVGSGAPAEEADARRGAGFGTSDGAKPLLAPLRRRTAEPPSSAESEPPRLKAMASTAAAATMQKAAARALQGRVARIYGIAWALWTIESSTD